MDTSDSAARRCSAPLDGHGAAWRRAWLPVLALFVALLAVGCDFNGSNIESEAVMLRVVNASPLDYSSVEVRFPGVEADFGAIPAGHNSDYQEVDTAYRYGYIEVVAGAETYRLVPIDYVGEEPLSDGLHSYLLTISGGALVLEYRRD